MNLDHPNFGQQYRLSRVAARLRTFTVSELMRLAGIGENTIYSFISKLAQLPQNYLHTETLPTSKRGRPRNRYTLTETGVDYLLQRNARIASILGAERSSSAAGSVVPPIMAVAEPAVAVTPTSAVAMVRAQVTAQAEALPKYAASASEPKRPVSGENMNKADLVDRVAGACNISKAQATTAIDTTVDTVTAALRKGDRVALIGFGTFSASQRRARNGRNPQTGATIKIAARRVAKFTPENELKKVVNKGKQGSRVFDEIASAE